MKSSAELNYTIHHLCIYDKDPRNHMWPYLRWHHGITNFFSGEVFHVTDEGHSDYTFLGCGGRHFQIQLEAPPFQFKYEQEWYKAHGNGYNHICWCVDDARASYEQVQVDGATIVQEFEEFPTYDGFVMKDPEGRWIEIMEYTDKTFRVQEFTNAPSGECGLEMIGSLEIVDDIDAMVGFYTRALDMKIIDEKSKGDDRLVFLGDRHWDPKEKNSLVILGNPRTAAEKAAHKDHGGYISAIVYQAANVARAYEDAIWAGMEAIEGPRRDLLTGALTARLREPSGNEILLREAFSG